MMPWEVVIALVIAIPIIVLPVVFIWYMNIKGVHEAIRKAREQQQIRQAELRREDRVRRLAHTNWQYINAYLGSSVKKTRGR
ncbi:hypothetical protein ES703_27245 [subsurface metagenome]